MDPYLGGRSPGCPVVVAPDSVKPHPSRISTPTFFFHFKATSTGSGAPPHWQSSSELKSYLSNSGNSNIWMYMVGTAAIWVTWNLWMACSASSTSHHRSKIVFPPTKLPVLLKAIPKECDRGSTPRLTISRFTPETRWVDSFNWSVLGLSTRLFNRIVTERWTRIYS